MVRYPDPSDAWTSERDAQLKQLYPETSDLDALAASLGKTLSSIMNRARRLGLKRVNKFKKMAVTRAQNSETCDWEYFNRELTPNGSYILGYSWADGCIDDMRNGAIRIPRTMKYACHRQDEDIILQIRKEVKSNHKIIYKEAEVLNSGINAGPRILLDVSNHLFVKPIVEKYGILPRKSYLDPPYPATIPNSLANHFARGVLDGDGSFSDSTFSWRGSYTFLNGLQKQISYCTGIRTNQITREENIWAIRWGGLNEVLILASWLYPEGDYICGSRKREKVKTFLNSKLNV
jgi:hypothetical protein